MDNRPAILPWNAGLVIIGLVDLITTLVWLGNGCVVECNPIMAAVLSASLSLFVATKLATLAAYVVVLEWYRRHRNAAFARWVGIAAVIGYISVYTYGFCTVNYTYFFG